MGHSCAKETAAGSAIAIWSMLSGPEVWGTDEGVWLTPFGVSVILGDTDSHHLCKTLFAPCSTHPV